MTDNLDFTADPSTVDEQVNKRRSKPKGLCVTGCTTILTDGQNRYTGVFMRAATGMDGDDPEGSAIRKITALLHELGHITDIEQGINYHGTSLELVKSEVFAHHFACREMVKGGYRRSLGFYLDGLEIMARSPSEYVRLAARKVLRSPEYAGYTAKARFD